MPPKLNSPPLYSTEDLIRRNSYQFFSYQALETEKPTTAKK